MPEFISIPDHSQYNIERWTSLVLRLGVLISASLMILGLLISSILPSSVITLSTNPSLGNLVLHISSGSFDPVTLMFAGLVLLMCTPILRVVTAMLSFAVERDLRFTFISSVVLIMLVGEIVYSLLLN